MSASGIYLTFCTPDTHYPNSLHFVQTAGALGGWAYDSAMPYDAATRKLQIRIYRDRMLRFTKDGVALPNASPPFALGHCLRSLACLSILLRSEQGRPDR